MAAEKQNEKRINPTLAMALNPKLKSQVCRTRSMRLISSFAVESMAVNKADTQKKLIEEVLSKKVSNTPMASLL